MDMTMRESTAGQTVIEREIGELIHRDVADLRKRSTDESDAANDISLLLRRMSVGSIHEIDALISELKVTRERLVIESERVHRELNDYAALSRSAMHATKIIAESLVHSSQIADSPGIAEEADEAYPHVVADTIAPS